ncbi:MAG: DUF6249 domain-containing protein [Saprospiraceae bacterium]
MEGVIVAISLFAVVFGTFYLFFSTRHKERLALIEKGVDAGIFISPKVARTAPAWKVVILNLALILMGIGSGIIVGSFLATYTVMGDAAYPACIFLISGIGLLVGFFQTKKIDK